ncbi:MAG: hypothetical protein VB055_06675 [Oscillospiraceae bacterium]|nr:hypothetical protein [Oscillospiraceae bacterium]
MKRKSCGSKDLGVKSQVPIISVTNDRGRGSVFFMKKWSDTRWNFAFYAGKEAAFNAALPFVSATLIQLFLAHKGVATEQIGLFNAITYLVNIGVMIFLSGLLYRQRENRIEQASI